ncbi:MAG: hypothetical protein AMJ93_08040 [Anaerolineae bacterium SM23_84]|jgi:hypothetical protein|nr:MAG: hypothetical protein AMJ93_08040 [Anaerolineae bacterium SM23_84]
MVDRIIRALRLDTSVFREIAEDQNAMTEAAIIVVAVMLLSAIGGAIGNAIGGASAGKVIGGFFFDWLAWGILLGWVGWAVVTYFVGTALFQGRTDIPEMMRVLGYASAPRLLGIFGIIPCLGWIAALAGAILSLIAGVLAIREAMEFDTGKAVITVVISWLVTLVVYLPIRIIFW